MENTFLRPQSAHLGDRCADAAYLALQEGGAELVSLGEISRRLRMTKSGLHYATGGRAGLIQLVLRVFGDRWLRWSTNPYRANDDVLQLPETGDEVGAVRMWVTMAELAAAEDRAGRPDPCARVAGYRTDERRALSAQLIGVFGRRPSGDEFASVHVMVEGLRDAVVAPVDPLPVWPARRLLAAHVERLRTVGPRGAIDPRAPQPSSSEISGLDETGAVPRDQSAADQLGRE
ncbi:hypothetical protein [Nocardioides sp. CER19]|uniref:hypothetical protein n=1 Tax=Nocardioides sp. CER19 TaxID=3038538 RepID=UPI00244A6434|nr:hypothetical protein [Nocardioides sp. CER19]MDH2413368.1 hypothetical protein [Nocardioides sp. CER19]